MKIYNVSNKMGYREDFYSLSEAKKAMKKNNAKGFITKVYSNGEWVSCGEIVLKGNNKIFVANTLQTKLGY